MEGNFGKPFDDPDGTYRFIYRSSQRTRAMGRYADLAVNGSALRTALAAD
jgi:hypothetical protein